MLTGMVDGGLVTARDLKRAYASKPTNLKVNLYHVKCFLSGTACHFFHADWQ